MNPNIAGVSTILAWSVMAWMAAMVSRIPSFEMVGITSFIGAAVLALYYKRRGKNIGEVFRRPVSDYIFVFSGVGLYGILVLGAYHHAPAFEVTTLNYLWPILLTLFLVMFQSLPFTFVRIAGFVIGFAGLVLLFWSKSSGDMFQSITAGHYMALAGAIIWALYSCFAREKNYPTVFLIPIYLLTGFFCLMLHLIYEETVMPTGKELILLLVIGGLRVTYALWDYAIRNGDRVLISSLAYFVPLLSALFLIMGGYGVAQTNIGLAAAMVITGCLIVNARQIIDAFTGHKR